MVKVILLTHSNLASALCETLALFFGDSAAIVPLNLTQDTGLFKNSVRRLVLEGPEREILVLVDVFGGTPFNTIVSMLKAAREQGKNVEVVTGVNLPMLLEIAGNLEDSSLDSLKEMALAAGRKGVRDLLAELKKKGVI